MPLTKNTLTGVIREYPINILRHRVLGKNLELYVEPVADEVEEDKVVIAKRVYKKSDPVSDTSDSEESVVTIDEAGD